MAEFLGSILSQSANNGADGGEGSEVDMKKRRKRKVSRDLSQELGSPGVTQSMGRVSI